MIVKKIECRVQNPLKEFEEELESYNSKHFAPPFHDD